MDRQTRKARKKLFEEEIKTAILIELGRNVIIQRLTTATRIWFYNNCMLLLATVSYIGH
jgi:hypothetical protein